MHTQILQILVLGHQSYNALQCEMHLLAQLQRPDHRRQLDFHRKQIVNDLIPLRLIAQLQQMQLFRIDEGIVQHEPRIDIVTAQVERPQSLELADIRRLRDQLLVVGGAQLHQVQIRQIGTVRPDRHQMLESVRLGGGGIRQRQHGQMLAQRRHQLLELTAQRQILQVQLLQAARTLLQQRLHDAIVARMPEERQLQCDQIGTEAQDFAQRLARRIHVVDLEQAQPRHVPHIGADQTTRVHHMDQLQFGQLAQQLAQAIQRDRRRLSSAWAARCVHRQLAQPLALGQRRQARIGDEQAKDQCIAALRHDALLSTGGVQRYQLRTSAGNQRQKGIGAGHEEIERRQVRETTAEQWRPVDHAQDFVAGDEAPHLRMHEQLREVVCDSYVPVLAKAGLVGVQRQQVVQNTACGAKWCIW